MIAEALDTLTTLGWALLGWITVLAAIGTIIILTTAATGVWAIGAARRAFRRHTDRDDYEEAA